MSAANAKTYIAVVEDDESLCRSLSRLLKASGYQPVPYRSAEEFIDDAKRPDFDCLIVDIQLGGMSGIQLNEQLADADSKTPVIFLTSSENTDSLKKRRFKHYTSLLRKSDSSDVLLAEIDKAIHAGDRDT